MKEEILNIIKKIGHFHFGPPQWSKYGPEIKELEEQKIIQSWGDYSGNHENNNDYDYILYGNPKNLIFKWIKVSNGYYEGKFIKGK